LTHIDVKLAQTVLVDAPDHDNAGLWYAAANIRVTLQLYGHYDERLGKKGQATPEK